MNDRAAAALLRRADDAALRAAPSIVLRPVPGPAVQHLVLRVPPQSDGQALKLLATLQPGFGPRASHAPLVSVGFAFAALQALRVPDRYRRVFHRLAPAFAAGAALDRRRTGDADTWDESFAPARAHVLVSWHGEDADVRALATAFLRLWQARVDPTGGTRHEGKDLEGPREGAVGRWVHFGYRDGLSEVVIDDAGGAGVADPRLHAAGELLLGLPNDAGHNRLALPRARPEVRRFFSHGSFGVFRPMLQDVALFEAQVDRWWQQLRSVTAQASRDFVKAKLCGRWPDGRVLLPGQFEPAPDAGFGLAPSLDAQGEGCPFGSHVRRLQPAPAADGLRLARPLQRRSVPFGAAWTPAEEPAHAPRRGLLGHFFCASIESQFEHLLGQWAAQAPLGAHPADDAADPLIGLHDDARAGLRLPLRDHATQFLRSFGAWTTTQGSIYAWYPGQEAWHTLLAGDFVPKEYDEPWV